ncbi:Nrap protein [Fimicolochytrium jonesii]|uniref:Nrap protein n=1 Tax=Fimicolochytrium jonesii TaxID=1396493 RepID=UPI0022FE4195|nr:Nrap protein [Fimicolochytrium jonesii]KAI8815755.1 Nrap protein [Fimicolochytrium jonesii]
MVAVKRKKSTSNAKAEAEAQAETFVDPYIDPSDDDEDDDDDEEDKVDAETLEMEDMVEDLIEGGSDDEEEEDDEDNGEEDGGADVDDEEGKGGKPFPTKPTKQNTNKLYAAPTSTEIQQLKETSDLFQSNLFKLQIEELLKEVRVDFLKSSSAAGLERALRRLKDVFDRMNAEVAEKSVAQATKDLEKEGVVVPFPDPSPPADAQYKLGFKKPTKVFVVGSYLLKTVAKTPSGTNVDVAVQMPESLFQDKDNVNYRYFYKRAYYLAMLAAEVKKHAGPKDLAVEMEFQAFQGDRRRPVLVLTSTGKNSEYDFKSKFAFSIRVFPVIPQNVFPPRRLAPGRNSVRANFLAGGGDLPESANTPTPHYNAALLKDTPLVAHMNLLHHHTTTCAGFREASILAKVWLAQRGFSGNTSKAGFNGFLFSMIMGYLLRTNDKNGNRLLGNNFSSYQLFKVTIAYIATHDFLAEPVFMTPDGKPLGSDADFSAPAFKAAYDVVIVDPSGTINMAASMSSADLAELQHEAKKSMAMLTDPTGTDHFDALFLKKVDTPHLRYDNVARVTIPPAHSPPVYTTPARLDHPSLHLYLLRVVGRTLKEALTNRATLVSTWIDALPAWSIDNLPVTYGEANAAVYVGLNLDAEHAIRFVEHGPSPDDAAAAEKFRNLWGPKSELRRFKNGEILESVLFDCPNTLDERALIVGKMVTYLLHRHITLPATKILYWAGQFNTFLTAPGISLQTNTFQTALDAFTTFAKTLRRLDGLPLSITQVTPIAPGLRHTAVFVPQPLPADSGAAALEAYRPFHAPLECIISFESSGRWPDDLDAIQLSKRAFYLRIAEEMCKQHPGTRAVVETGKGGHVGESGGLEVTTVEGYTFRCTIHVERERHLLEKIIEAQRKPKTNNVPLGLDTSDNTVSTKWTQESYTAALAYHTKTYINTPYHAHHIATLCTTHTFLPHAIRLTKRWLGAHMLSPHVSDEWVESVVVAALLADGAEVPASPSTAFLRVLHVLAHWDFRSTPLVASLDPEAVSLTIRREIHSAFTRTRADPAAKNNAAVMCVAHARDIQGTWWKEGSPGVAVAERIGDLARACLGIVESLLGGKVGGSRGVDRTVMKLFTPTPTHFDILVPLSPAHNPRYREHIHYNASLLTATLPKYKNLVPVADRTRAVVATVDTVRSYVAELRRMLGEAGILFVDEFGGCVVGVVVRPAVKDGAAARWRVENAWNVVRCGDEDDEDVDEPARKKKKGTMVEKERERKGGKKELMVRPNLRAMVAEMQRLGEGLVLGVDVRCEI